MARQAIVRNDTPYDDKKRDAALRPRFLRDVIGQRQVKQRLEILLRAAKKLNEPMSHMLFDGPPGLGKTTFANCIPRELNVPLVTSSGS